MWHTSNPLDLVFSSWAIVCCLSPCWCCSPLADGTRFLQYFSLFLLSVACAARPLEGRLAECALCSTSRQSGSRGLWLVPNYSGQ